MFKKKHKYQIVFADGSSVYVEGFDISVWDDDNDQTKGDIYIKMSHKNNDCAWFRKETLKYIVSTIA